jgi:hypothetical protein
MNIDLRSVLVACLIALVIIVILGLLGVIDLKPVLGGP